MAREGLMPHPSVEEASRLVRRAAGRPLTAVFLARGMRALARMAEDLEPDALVRAAGAENDFAVLLHALGGSTVLAILGRADPLAKARLRGLAARRALLSAEGGTCSAAEAADLLRLSRQAVDKRRKAGTLLAVSLGRHGYAYPVWQFDEGGVRADIAPVLEALAACTPWLQLAFFLTPNAFLNRRRPLDVLRDGDLAAVLRAARAEGEQGAA